MEDNHPHYQAKFKKLIGIQVILVLIAAIAFIYISLETRQQLTIYSKVTRSIDSIQQEYNRLNEEYKKAQDDFEKLKMNLENHNTAIAGDNEIYEVLATSRSTGQRTRNNKPVFDFKIYINSPDNVLDKISKAVYHFDHETFRQQVVESSDRKNKFATGYMGWGCLEHIPVEIHLQDSTVLNLNFHMCKSIEDGKSETLSAKRIQLQ